MDKELDTVRFHRKQILKQLKEKDLLTLADADEHKLTAINELLHKMRHLNDVLKKVGIFPIEDTRCAYPCKNTFILTDTGYEDWPEFKIKLQSDWFDSAYPFALHANFLFSLDVVQDGYTEKPREIADWITIRIQYVNVRPISWASTHEHVRTLYGFSAQRECSYFDDLKLDFATHVSFERDSHKLSLRTDDFVRSVNDACKVMQKIIDRRSMLKTFNKRDKLICG